jgi:hypothetical protein
MLQLAFQLEDQEVEYSNKRNTITFFSSWI